MQLRAEDKDNTEEIQQLFLKTFTEAAGASEGASIGELTSDLLTSTPEDDLYCYTATENEKIIGCIIFSTLRFENSTLKAFLLSPVAVDTSYQKKGIGQALINFGLDALQQDGVELALTYGDPKYYSKVGFHKITEELVKAPLTLSQPEGWLGQSLTSDDMKPISGKSFCVDALNKPEYW